MPSAMPRGRSSTVYICRRVEAPRSASRCRSLPTRRCPLMSLASHRTHGCHVSAKPSPLRGVRSSTASRFACRLAAQPLVDTLRTALAHVLINRDGPALQPGSQAYERSWIRDGALTSEALLRLGHEEVVRDFLRWYAPYQFSDGKVPCCVDARGADPVPEHDSHGEFVFLVWELYRYARDRSLLEAMWPHVGAAAAYMETLRQSERIAANLVPERRAFYGLLPASISHEGYAAKPMHSYWDDFWALKGYKNAAAIATALGSEEAAMRLAR